VLAPPSLLEGWRHFNLTIGWKPADYDLAQQAWPKVLASTKYVYDFGLQLTAGIDIGVEALVG
jgi:hypothetical protein